MKSTGNRILLGIAAVLVAAVIAWIIHSNSIPDFSAEPVPKNAPTLNGADIEKVLGVEQFRVVRQVRQVPATVRQSFSNFTGLPFDLVDPGGEIKGDDLTVRAHSSRRLVFLGLSEDSAILVYEQGGFADICNVVVFWFGDSGRDWGANLDSIPNDMASLKAAIQKRQFHIVDGPQFLKSW